MQQQLNNVLQGPSAQLSPEQPAQASSTPVKDNELSLDGSDGDGDAEASLDSQQMNLKASAFVPTIGRNNESSSPSGGSPDATALPGQPLDAGVAYQAPGSQPGSMLSEQERAAKSGVPLGLLQAGFPAMVENSGISLQDLTTVHQIFTMAGQPGGGSRRKRHGRKNRHKYQQEQFQQIMMPFDSAQLTD